MQEVLNGYVSDDLRELVGKNQQAAEVLHGVFSCFTSSCINAHMHVITSHRSSLAAADVS